MALEGLLFQVRPADLPTFLTVPAFIAAVSMLACYLPARRASSIHPLEALTDE